MASGGEHTCWEHGGEAEAPGVEARRHLLGSAVPSVHVGCLASGSLGPARVLGKDRHSRFPGNPSSAEAVRIQAGPGVSPPRLIMPLPP